jgi:hypothetical protein
MRLETRPVSLLEGPVAVERVGRLLALGMLELPDVTADGQHFSELSGLAWDDDDGVLYAVSDNGALFRLRPRFRDGRLAGLELLGAARLREADGTAVQGDRADSEGLDVLNGRNGRTGDAELVVSFERLPRIARYRPDGVLIGDYRLPAPLDAPAAYRGRNSMLESVCVDDALGVLTVPEWPLRGEPETSTRIHGLDGRSWVHGLAGPHRISAIECLGHRRLLVLENAFTVLDRSVTLRLVTLTGDGSQGSVTAAETAAVLDAARRHRIDNFEGLTRHTGNRFFMVSDDNGLLVQRQLLLYFELADP